MSTEKAVGINVGGALIGAGAAVAAVAALGVAAAATLGLMKAALDAARDAIEKAKIEKRRREISDLQEELAAGTRTAEKIAENVKSWRLEAKCKALDARLHRVGQRAAITGLDLRETPPAHSPSREAGSAELEREVARLEDRLRQQEDVLRKAITGALETHAAKQGAMDAIDRLAALPAPSLEKPADLLGYFEETLAVQRHKRNATAVTLLRESLHRALETLPEQLPRSTAEEIGRSLVEFAAAQDESAASTGHRRVIDLIERAHAEARTIEPLRARMARARELAADLVYAQLSEADQRLLADEDSVPDAEEVARLEGRLRGAKASDAARISNQQRRLAMAATLDALQGLGYDTSVVDEATWFKNGSMFISRPEWGGYVVRLTPRDGKFVMFAGRYVDDASWKDAEETITPEMEKFYGGKIDDWCKSRLPDLVKALKQRNIALNVEEGETDVHAIQPVARDEIGDAMAKRIETRVDERERRGGVRVQARKA
jgi:hypothetical protein